MTKELLPCPFCGSEAKIIHDTSSDYERQWTWGIECTSAVCEARVNNYTSEDSAVTWWNRRQCLSISDERVKIAFHNWIVSYETDFTMRWDQLMPQEWDTLAQAQWQVLKDELLRVSAPPLEGES